MAARDPWMKFYPQDWRADEKLRMCSLAARGLWIEMLALMHRSERYGQLLIGGRVPTDAQLAVQVGALPDEVTAMLVELSDAGVFSRAASGVIYSRRMTRDHKKAEIARKNGKKGGNPSLGKQTGKTASDNHGLSRPLNSEARSQKLEAAKAASASEPDIPELAARIADATGYNAGGWKRAVEHQELVREWISAGATETQIVETINARAAAAKDRPKTLAWFRNPVLEALNTKQAGNDAALSDAVRMAQDIMKNKRNAA